MSTTNEIPGIKSVHRFITPTCERNKGFMAFQEVMQELANAYSKGREAYPEADFHFVLTVVDDTGKEEGEE